MVVTSRSARPGAGRRRLAASALLGAAAAGLLGAAQVLAAELGPPRAVGSAVSPFAGCTADRVARQDGTNYPNTEIEPWVDASPGNPAHLIAAWQQDRWSNGGARGLAAGISRDGGRTWRTVVPPGISLCSGGDYVRASDPWVSFGPGGTAYLNSLAFDPDLPEGGFGPNGILVNRSTDGGLTWGPPATLIRDTDPQVLNDKNSLTADPTNANFAYAVWDRLQDFTLPGGEVAFGGGGAPGARARAKALREGAAARTAAAAVFFKGPAYLARTRDGGRSWERAKEIYDPGGNAQTIGNQVVVTPDGTVLDFFTEITPAGGSRLALLRSTDKGGTFERRPTYVAEVRSSGTVTPDAEAPVRDASILFDVAVDRNNGNLYAVWQDTRFRGVEEVAFALSTDGGRTWSPPSRINRTPAAANPLRRQAFVPSVAVGPNGVLVVTYYDFRNDGGSGELADHWAISCDPNLAGAADDCRVPARWRDDAELRLTQRSFDMLRAPVARGQFLGDYVGLVRAGSRVQAVYGVADGNDRTSLFARAITALGSGGATAATAATAATVAAVAAVGAE